MIVVSRIKSNCLSLEICQSQYERDTYFAVVINISKVVWTQAFNEKQIAEQKGQAMFKAFCLTEKYLDLSERAYQKALFAKEDGESVQADIFLKKAFFYKKRYDARRMMGLSIEY